MLLAVERTEPLGQVGTKLINSRAEASWKDTRHLFDCAACKVTH